MIYLVTKKQELFDDPDYTIINAQQALEIMQDWKVIQYDSETNGRDPHLCKLLCAQFGNDSANVRIVLDCESYSITLFKNILESKLLIGHNLKFDLQFLFNHNIIPRKVYDTMIVEQFLYLGFPNVITKKEDRNYYDYSFLTKLGYVDYKFSYSLAAVAKRRLDIDIDKTVRGEIIWRGLDKSVVLYSAGDVTFLEQLMWSQVKDYKARGGTVGAKLECDFVPAIAYLEWCGIKLDVDKWREKMKKDQENLDKSIKALNDFVINTPALKEFVYIERQGDLFSGFDTSPRVNINWASSAQATKVFKLLGFDVNVVDKDSGEDKESAMEKHMKKQKGINDAFLRLYFGKGEEGEENYFPGYNGSAKVVSSFGQGHIDAINPKTGRIHTSYKQIGASSGRMSCGSKQPNTDLAKYKKLPEKSCKYPNIQQLPKDVETRACFISEENNLFCSCDYSALESRLGADIYNEQSMIEEFLHGSGDMHSLCAYMVYKDEIPRDTPIKSIKKLYPHLRSAVKPIEFSQQFGGSEYAIQNSMGCSLEEALTFKKAYDSGFPGIAKFKEAGAKFVCSNGYILMNKYTGHKMYWWDWEHWKQKQAEFNTPGFWDTYKLYHKGQKTNLEKAVKKHFKIKSKYERMALNSPTQGTGITILKDAMTTLFNWVVDNGYFGKVLFCAFVHDECDIEFPKELTDFPKIVSDIMLNSAAKFCKSIPIPAEAEVSTHWIH